MKKLCLALLMCLLAAAVLAAPVLGESAAEIAARTGMAEENNQAGSVMYVVNCNEWVSLREEPSTSAARVAAVPLGAAVTNCQSVSTTFTYCQYNGAWGYVLTEYLSTNAPMTGGSDSYVGEMRVVNCNEWVSLRSQPSTSSSRIAKVPLGAVLMECTRYSSQFVYGNYNGQWGYVLSEYLSRVPDQVVEGQGYVGDMRVVNCDQWVSLREEPSTSAARIATVPLGATVSNCTWYSNNFISCEYNGMVGYILSSYLQPVGKSGFAAMQPEGDAGSFMAVQPIEAVQPQSNRGRLILEHAIGEYTVYAYYDYANNGESLYVECLNGQGGQVWNYATYVPYSTELQGADAFAGGTIQRPMVLVYNSAEGLYALDFYTGQMQWLVDTATANLGGSISHAVAGDGTMYIGGYYGPDPVAIDASGKVLWQAITSHDAYWMHEIEVTENGIVATYDCIDEHEAKGQITYGFDGSERNVIWF